MDDRQTDHATEKCVGIGGVSCTVRAIPPHKTIGHAESRANATGLRRLRKKTLYP